jgi:periplasmic mercuric ion binding protein
MRTILLSFILFLSAQIFGQDKSVKTETFVVKGNCEDCKERIENSADIKGVKILTWDVDKKIATVTYRADKITLEQIQKAIAAKGYDAGNVKGDEKAYNKLPGCCQYRDRACEDKKQ